MSAFYKLLGNSLVAAVTNYFVWFALTYWAYLETKSVIATAVISGIFLVFTALGGFWFGSIVDHHKKKYAMLLSSIATLGFFVLGFLIYVTAPEGSFTTIASFRLWLLIFILMLGVIAGNIRTIAMPTLITILIPENRRDKANGMLSTVMGVAFAITSVASGLALGYSSMFWVIILSIVFTVVAIIHLAFLTIPQKEIVHTQEHPKKLDIKGTITAVKTVPGLFALIFFSTFNNFLGGVFMSLMDAYGLSLVSVQVWGILWGFLSLGFIVGGLYIAKKGLGSNPLKNLFRINIVLWIICIVMAIQPWIALLAVCMFIWITLIPFVEATEHTIIQKVVPMERQGRVFGFAQSVEQTASPITAFLIGPITQLIFIPFMTTGAGVGLIGDWFGVGTGRGIALVFILAGIIGLIVTLVAMRSRSYKLLNTKYQESPASAQ